MEIGIDSQVFFFFVFLLFLFFMASCHGIHMQQMCRERSICFGLEGQCNKICFVLLYFFKLLYRFKDLHRIGG